MVNRLPTVRRVWPLRVLAFAALVILAAPLLRAVPSADAFDELYQRGLARQRTMHSLHAKFTETTTSSLLMKPLVAHGTIVAASPARVLMTYTDPEQKTLTMDGKTMTISWPARHERQSIDIREMQKRIDHYFTSASADDLKSMFTVTMRTDATAKGSDLVDMRPKRKQIQQGLERLELWIDRDSNMLMQMRLTFPGGDQKTVTLEDITLNVPVTDDMFRTPADTGRAGR